MYAWCVTLAGAACATRFVPPRRAAEWHLWPTLLALADRPRRGGVLDLRRCYVLEIVKLTNRRGRRREAEAEREREPPSARRSAASSALNGSPSAGIEWPAPGRTARSRLRRCSRTSQTASKAALCPPETTSLGNGAAASFVERDRPPSGRALRAQRRARPPRSRAGAGRAGSERRPDEREEGDGGIPACPSAPSPRSASKWARRLLDRRVPRARPKAGGSTTVSEARGGGRRPPRAARRRRRRSGPRGGPRLEERRELGCLLLEVDPRQSRVRRVAGPDGDDELEAVGERLLRVPGGAPGATGPWTRTSRGPDRRDDSPWIRATDNH